MARLFRLLLFFTKDVNYSSARWVSPVGRSPASLRTLLSLTLPINQMRSYDLFHNIALVVICLYVFQIVRYVAVTHRGALVFTFTVPHAGRQ